VPSDPLVTLCVPVFSASAVVVETLTSIQAQTFENFRVSISVDAGGDDSAAACLPFTADKRFVISEQHSRLGWVDNCNWLISRVETPYFCIMPHDDLLEPDYLLRLIEAAKSYPEAAVIFSDLVSFGSMQNKLLTQPSIVGCSFTRATTFLIKHYNAVAFRGLVRTVVVAGNRLLDHNPFDDFAEDTVWLLKLALQGDLIRVPELLYRKRATKGGARRQWPTRSNDKERQFAAWEHHCFELAVLVLRSDFSAEQRKLLVRAIIRRLLNEGTNVGPLPPAESLLGAGEQDEYVKGFLSHLGDILGEEMVKALV